MPEARLRILVACGAAGGISATFNAPIAGVFFGLELILREVSGEAFVAILLSSMTADVIGRAAFGSRATILISCARATGSRSLATRRRASS